MASNWKDRAVSNFRQQGLSTRLRALLDVDIDTEQIVTSSEGSSIILDGVTFVMVASTGQLEAAAPCPRCKKMQPSTPVQSVAEVGRVLDSLCRDCDFLSKSGLSNAGL